MSSFWTLIFLVFIFCSDLSEANHQNKLPSAIVVGTVYCDTCFQANHFIAGASVEVQCNETGSRQGFQQEVKTDSHGEFKIHLPFFVSKHVKKIRGCSVRLIRSNEPFCAVAASATSSSLHLKSRKDGAHIFSAGFFSFKPLNQPQVCDQKQNSNENKISENSNTRKETDQLPFLPNPLNPLPLPPNPLLPPPSILPPNPFQPPPSVLPPVLPTPPPSILPPGLPIPPVPPFNLPPLPGLSPSPPPPPTFPIPLPPLVPPLPFPPGFPGVPPADVSSQSTTASP